MKKIYAILATLALALSLNSVAAWAVEKSDKKAIDEKSAATTSEEQADQIKIIEDIKSAIDPEGSSPDCRGGGSGL